MCWIEFRTRGVSSRGLEHPPKVWHNNQLSSCVTSIIILIKQLLVAYTNNKLTGLALNGSFTSLQGLKCLLCHQAIFKNALVRGMVNTFGVWLKFCAHTGSDQHLPSLLRCQHQTCFSHSSLLGDISFFKMSWRWCKISLQVHWAVYITCLILSLRLLTWVQALNTCILVRKSKNTTRMHMAWDFVIRVCNSSAAPSHQSNIKSQKAYPPLCSDQRWASESIAYPQSWKEATVVSFIRRNLAREQERRQ